MVVLQSSGIAGRLIVFFTPCCTSPAKWREGCIWKRYHQCPRGIEMVDVAYITLIFQSNANPCKGISLTPPTTMKSGLCTTLSTSQIAGQQRAPFRIHAPFRLHQGIVILWRELSPIIRKQIKSTVEDFHVIQPPSQTNELSLFLRCVKDDCQSSRCYMRERINLQTLGKMEEKVPGNVNCRQQ